MPMLDDAKLARELATRAQRILPSSVSVRAEGSVVFIEGRDRLPSAIQLFRDSSRPVEALVGLLARNVLSTLQDVMARETAEPWPSTDRNPSATLPHVAVRNGVVHMWYGDDARVLVELQPLLLTDVLRS